MGLTKSEKAFVVAFATSVVALLVAGSVTDTTELYGTGLILLLPWAVPLLAMIMPIWGLILVLTDPVRSAGYPGVADALGTWWAAGTVVVFLVGAPIGQALTLVFGWRGVRQWFARGRGRYCRHARPVLSPGR